MAETPGGTMPTQRVCILVENTWAMASQWSRLKRCLEAILASLSQQHKGACEIALITFGSPRPYSTCPLQSSHWTQDLDSIRRCSDGIQPSLGGCCVQPLLAVALVEAAYLFECPSVLTPDSSSIGCQCLALVASEPSKTPVPWPHPEECYLAPGLAGYAELCMALKRRGIEFSFLAPTHLACQDAISRVGRAFVSAQGFKSSSEARRTVTDLGTSIRCFIAPSWALAMTALQPLASDPAFIKDASPGPDSASTIQAQQASSAASQQAKAEPKTEQPVSSANDSTRQQQQQQQLPPQQKQIWQGQMLLGEAITRGAPQVLWECSALVLGSEPGELALTWPHELVIDEVNKDPLLIADLRDTGKQRSRGVIQLTKADELGKRLVEKLTKQQLMAQIDMSQFIGVAASMVVMTLPTKKANPAGTGKRLLFIVVERSAGAPP